MKKLVLILVCTVIMTVLIALNYLLWDKEESSKNIANLKYSNESKDASIDVLGNEIKNSKDKMTELNNRIQSLEDSIKSLDEVNNKLQQKELETNDLLEQKNEMIDKLKVQSDIKPFESVIGKWAEALDKGEYDVANNLIQKNNSVDVADSMKDFQNNVKSLKIKEFKLEANDNKAFEQGTIVFAVVLELKLSENAEATTFVEGNNKRYMTFDYEKKSDLWLISDILVVP